jgi:hypothetical protein
MVELNRHDPEVVELSPCIGQIVTMTMYLDREDIQNLRAALDLAEEALGPLPEDD